jgi:hypothetical protein
VLTPTSLFSNPMASIEVINTSLDQSPALPAERSAWHTLSQGDNIVVALATLVLTSLLETWKSAGLDDGSGTVSGLCEVLCIGGAKAGPTQAHLVNLGISPCLFPRDSVDISGDRVKFDNVEHIRSNNNGEGCDSSRVREFGWARVAVANGCAIVATAHGCRLFDGMASVSAELMVPTAGHPSMSHGAFRLVACSELNLLARIMEPGTVDVFVVEGHT